MAIDFLEYLKETFEEVGSLNREKIRDLYRESHIFFASLGEMIQSGNVGAKERALSLVAEIKQFLDGKAQQMTLGASGLNEEETAIVAELEESFNVRKEGKAKKHKKLKPKNMS